MSKENPFESLLTSGVKIRYKIEITQAVNGYVCKVEQAEGGNKIDVKEVMGEYVDAIKGMMQGDSEIAQIYKQHEKKVKAEEEVIEKIGLHIFKTFSEMVGFLSLLFEESAGYPKEKAEKKHPQKNN